MKKVYTFAKILLLLTCMITLTHQNVLAQCINQGSISDPGCGGTVTQPNVGGGQNWTLNSTIGADYTVSIGGGSSGCGGYSLSLTSFTASGSSVSEDVYAGGSCCWAAAGTSATLTYTQIAYTNTTSNANICQGTPRALTVSPTPFTAGTWSVINGTGTGTITGTTFNAVSPGTVTIRYTKGTCNSDVGITIDATPSTSTVGANQSVCGLTSNALGGNTPASGTGTWTQIAGPGGTTFGNANTGNTTATATAYGTYTYEWTIANGSCAPSTATLNVTYSQAPTVATVGATQNICGSLVTGSLGGNTPAVGTGTWTQTTGPGVTTFSNVNSGTSTATASVIGTYTYTWTIANGACTSSSATMTVNYYATPTTAAAGGTQNLCGTLVSGALGGNSPAIGTGAWSQTSGPGTTTFSNVNSGSATATATVAGTYVYTWTISNGTCVPSIASVTVNFYATPTTATVGATQNICGSLTTASLGGNTPAAGTGTWTQASGPGTTTFSNSHLGSSTATATVVGTYTYTWTIANGTCPSSSATMTVNYYTTPTTSTVGATQNICGSLTSAALGGNTPVVGIGTWTQTSGPGTTFFSGVNTGSSTAAVSAPGTYVFTWTIANGTCTSAASVTVNYYATPTTATVGLDQSICGLTSNALGGNTPAAGIGAWSQTAGPGTTTFSNASSGSSTATATLAGTYTYAWTISNGTCAPNSASINVTYYNAPTTATVGATQNLCGTLTTASLGGNTPVTGTGVWTQASGPGTTTFSNASSGTSTATASVVGTYTYTWTISNGVCAPSAATVTVNYYATPTTATAGATQNICGSLVSGALGGNAPAVGTGLWTQTSGPGTTTFGNATSGTSTATATVVGTYVYTWTISNGTCAPSSATQTVNFYATPTTATVGATQNLCGSLTSASLGGNTPAVGTGTWTKTSGPGTVTFSNASSGTSTATVSVAGTYLYTWTITNGTCAPSSASVTVNYYAVPTVATAGPLQNICGSLTSGSLGGNTPAIGTGVWTKTSGPGISSFSNANNGAATVAVSLPGTYVFTWTISNGTCPSTSANVTVNFYATPTTATVGSTQNICGSLTTASLGGNTPSAGTGTWTQTSGPGTSTFSNASSGTSTATATLAGSYVYTWTISNGTCPPSSASVSVNFIITPTGGNIPNTSYCSSVGSGSATVVGVSNATQYAWSLPAGLSGSSSTATISVGGTVPGSYTVTVTPQDVAFGVTCSGTPITGTVTILSQPVIDSVNAGTLSCFGGNNDTITVYATTTNGNLFYSIDGGTTYTNTTGVFPGLGAGSYTVVVKDDSSCGTTYGANPVKVIPPSPILLSIASFSNVLCHGDSTGYIDLSASGGTGVLTFLWNNGATSQNINHLALGTFTVTVTDANGCTGTISQQITQPTALTDSISATNITCYGANNASATFIVNGGTTPYKFLWSNGDTSQTINNLNGAVYSVTATDNHGCIAVNSVNIINPQPVSVTLTVTNVTCFGNSNGSIVASATGGTGAYTYTWSPAVSTTATVSGAGPGTYKLTVSDVNNCSVVDSATVTQPLTGLSATTVVTPIGCTGGSNGSINLLASGGLGGYTYHWSSGQNIQIISGLGNGIYIGTVTDGNGCTAIVTDTLKNPTPIVSTITGTNVTCYNAANGSANLTVNGGVPSYSILWDNFDTTYHIAGLAPGVYRVHVTDTYGCVHSDSILITGPAQMTGSISVSNVLCNGSNIDTISVIVSGGNAGAYTYTWSPSVSTTSMVTNVAPGLYKVTVTDTKGCTFTDSATITQPLTALSISATAVNITCHNANNGSITVLANGGAGGYTYSWTGGMTTSTISGLSAGNYTVTVKDGNGCTASLTKTIVNPAAITSSVVGVNVTCAGAGNGSATLTVNGGIAPYTYLWSNFETTKNLTNIAGGTYRVIITDANGCQHDDSVVITEPLPMTAVIRVTNVGCNGGNTGSVVVTVSGGTPAVGGYTYTWSPVASSVDSVSGVGPGTYTVTATDSHGCSVIASGTVTQLASTLSANSVVTDMSCHNANNGSITVLPSGGAGGYTYSWTGGMTTSTISGLAAGTYTVTVKDGNGCTVSLSDTIHNPTAITSSIVGVNVTCAGASNGSATLTVNGGTGADTYLWSNFETTQNLTNIPGGTYRVIITDANGCKHEDSVIITEPLPMTAAVRVTNVLCNGGNTGSVVVTVAGGTPAVGGYTYTWSPIASSVDSVSGVGPGTYTVTATDSHGCSVIASGTVTQPASAVSFSTVVDSITCHNSNNGSISVLASGGAGGYTYNWTGGMTTSSISGLSSGTYSVTVKDANGCSASSSTTLSNPSAITSNVVGVNVTCAGAANGSATLTVNGGTPGYTYLWSTFAATQSLTNLSGGTYRVIITDAHGCEHRDSVIITEPLPMSATVRVTNVLCNGGNTGSVVVTVAGGTPAVGGYTYAWSPVASSVDSVSGVGPGTYTVTATDSHGCSVIASGTVTQPATALSVLSNVVNVSCGGVADGSISLSVNGGTPGYSFAWASGQHTQNISGLSAGIYTVTVSDVNGCSKIVSDTVKAPIPITASIVGTNVTCAGANNGSATLTVGGGTLPYTFLWSNFSGSQNIDSLTGGWYYVIITDGYGCQKRDSIKILEPLPLTVTDSIAPVSCTNGNNGAIYITATGGTGAYTYTWTPAGPNSPNNTGLTAGTYTVTVTDVNRCTASLTIQIANPAPLALTYTLVEPRCNTDRNGSISLIAGGGTPQYSYAWTPAGPNAPVNTNLISGTYQVTVTDSRGCHISDTIVLSEPAPMYVSGIQKNVSCHGNSDGYILPTGYGGTQPYSFQWYLGADTFAPVGPITENITQLPGGDYYLIITDANGCQVPFTRHIREPDSLLVTLSETDLTCAGANSGTVKASVTGGTTPYQYLWNNFTTDTVQTGVGAGIYTVVVTDSNGCHVNRSITVSQPLPITITSIVKNPHCNGSSDGAIMINVQGGRPGYTYSWNTNPVQTTSSITNLTAGVYIVVVTDTNGCSRSDTIILTAPSAMQVNTAVSEPTCSGGSNGFVSLGVTGGSSPYSYNWSTTPAQAGNVASALIAGTYYATITDAHGCVLFDTAVVVSPQPIVVTIGAGSSTCASSAAGIVVVDATGGLAPYSYELGTLTQSSDTFRNLSAGVYTVEVTDMNGCQGTAPVTVSAVGRFTDTLTANPNVILAGEIVQLYANASSDTTIVSYIWYPSDSMNYSACGSASNCDSPTVRPTRTQDYIVTVVNARGCSITDTVHVTVSNQPSMFIPTGFTPNGDGLNDRFEFDILGATTINVQIWDRWGELVYSNPAQANGTNGIDGWDGTFRGQPVAFDTYTYQFDITYFDGHHQTIAGSIAVIR